MFVIGELNWKDVMNNSINESSDDDENYVFSNDTYCTSDDNNEYYENVDIETLLELKIDYYISRGITIRDTSSNDSSIANKSLSITSASKKNQFIKFIIKFIYHQFIKKFRVFLL